MRDGTFGSIGVRVRWVSSRCDWTESFIVLGAKVYNVCMCICMYAHKNVFPFDSVTEEIPGTGRLRVWSLCQTPRTGVSVTRFRRYTLKSPFFKVKGPCGSEFRGGRKSSQFFSVLGAQGRGVTLVTFLQIPTPGPSVPGDPTTVGSHTCLCVWTHQKRGAF